MSRVRLTGTPLAEQLRAAVPAAMAAAGREVGPQIVRAIQADDRQRFRRFGSARARMIGWRIRKDGALVVRDRSRTAAIHEHGGVIVPQRGRYLLVPFEAAAYDGSDSDRKTEIAQKYGDPSVRLGDFVIKDRRGRLLLMRKYRNMTRKRAKALHRAGGWGRTAPKAYPVGVLVRSVKLVPRTRFEEICRRFHPTFVRRYEKYFRRLEGQA